MMVGGAAGLFGPLRWGSRRVWLLKCLMSETGALLNELSPRRDPGHGVARKRQTPEATVVVIRSATVASLVTFEMRRFLMVTTIGIDPHKATHTAVDTWPPPRQDVEVLQAAHGVLTSGRSHRPCDKHDQWATFTASVDERRWRPSGTLAMPSSKPDQRDASPIRPPPRPESQYRTPRIGGVPLCA